MKHTLYIYIAAFLLSALTCGCSHQEEPLLPQGSGTLSLQLHRVGCMTETRTVSSELAVTIVGTDGPVATFAPGQVPDKIKLEPGNYELFAYTDNQETWEQDNEGRGSACHWGTTSFSISYDNVTYVDMQVPMTNYAVTLTLPDLFDQLFKSYSFLLTSSGRTDVVIREGEKAYFEAGTGFTYKLTATNNDNKTSSHSAISFSDTEAGKLYNIKYIYGSDLNQGGIDIEITDNEEHEDVDINL